MSGSKKTPCIDGFTSCPAQGHAIPFMELAHCLVFKISFLNTELNHSRVVATPSKKGDDMGHVRLFTIPDGLEPGEGHNHLGKLTESTSSVMPVAWRR